MHSSAVILSFVALSSIAALPHLTAQSSISLSEAYKLPQLAAKFSKDGQELYCSSPRLHFYYVNGLVRHGDGGAFVVSAADGRAYDLLESYMQTLQRPCVLYWSGVLLDRNRIAHNGRYFGHLNVTRSLTHELNRSEAIYAGDRNAKGLEVNLYNYDVMFNGPSIEVIFGGDGSFCLLKTNSTLYKQYKQWEGRSSVNIPKAASWNEKMLAHSERHGNITIHEVESGNEVFSIDLPGNPEVTGLSFSRDNTHILALCVINSNGASVSWGEYFPEQAERAKTFFETSHTITYLTLINLRDGTMLRVPTPDEDMPIAASRDNDLVATNKGMYSMKNSRRVCGFSSETPFQLVFSPTDDLLVINQRVFRYSKTAIDESLFK